MTVEHRAPGLVLREHELAVPLDHARPGGETLTLFAREVADPDGLDRPFLVFLQGGPGLEAPRPTAQPRSPGWLDRALRDFRVLLLDQRGTGRSSPVALDDGRPPAEQAERLAHFRADAIVRDCEALRAALGVDRWSVLGQSFGGFCVTAYLSLAPEGLREAFIAGGLPPLRPDVDDVYRATWARTIERNRRYFERYPGDRERLRALRRRVADEPLVLPSGDRLTARRLTLLGQDLGMSDGPERLHGLLELPPASPAFLHDADGAVPYARNPLYAALHEACWADACSTRWAAERTHPGDEELLLCEHVLPWLFDELAALRPLREAAHLLADRAWGPLYDPERLAANEVPCAAAIYTEDPYVERRFSEETAARIRGMRTWVTSEFDHNGLRADGERVLGRLIDLARGRA